MIKFHQKLTNKGSQLEYMNKSAFEDLISILNLKSNYI